MDAPPILHWVLMSSRYQIDPVKTPISLRSRALNYLSRKEMSRQELAQKLAPYTEDPQELTDLLEEFARHRWQSDERFTESFIASRSHKYGARRLSEELRHKGVDENLIKTHQISKEAEIQNALAILQKKFAHLPQSPEEKNKQMRFLAYRGFDFDIIHTVFSLRKENQEQLSE